MYCHYVHPVDVLVRQKVRPAFAERNHGHPVARWNLARTDYSGLPSKLQGGYVKCKPRNCHRRSHLPILFSEYRTIQRVVGCRTSKSSGLMYFNISQEWGHGYTIRWLSNTTMSAVKSRFYWHAECHCQDVHNHLGETFFMSNLVCTVVRETVTFTTVKTVVTKLNIRSIYS